MRPESTGPISPISDAWEEFRATNKLTPETEAAVKKVFFVGAMISYNYMSAAIRRDPSLRMLNIIGQAIYNDVNDFMTMNFEKPSLN
jgi:hypothetical protein